MLFLYSIDCEPYVAHSHRIQSKLHLINCLHSLFELLVFERRDNIHDFQEKKKRPNTTIQLGHPICHLHETLDS